MTNAWFKAVATAFLFTLSLASASAQTKCVFSDRPSDAKFENDKSVSKYTWNKDSREAKIITAGGNLISAKYWACDHYGTHVVMLLGPYPRDDLDAIGKKFTQLADLTLEASEAKIVRNHLQKNPIALSGDTAQVDIPNTGNSEFYLRYSVVYDSVVLEIKFYKN